MESLVAFVLMLCTGIGIVIVFLYLCLFAVSIFEYLDHAYQKSKYRIKNKTKKTVRH